MRRERKYQKPPSKASGSTQDSKSAPAGLVGRWKLYFAPAACKSSTSLGSLPATVVVSKGTTSCPAWALGFFIVPMMSVSPMTAVTISPAASFCLNSL